MPNAVEGLGRAFAGALLFSMPLLMTMELWRLAVTMQRWHVAVLVVATVVLTVGLAHTFGAIHGNASWADAAVDAGVAFVAGVLAAALVLSVLGIIYPVRSWTDAVSILSVEVLPASIGAAYARGQLGQESGDRAAAGYGHELFLMAAGAVVFASNIAPTEEVVLLAGAVTAIQALLLVVLSLGLMHVFVYGTGFAGEEESTSTSRAFLTLTVPGYVIALGLSAFLLWSFGRYDETSTYFALTEAVVLALPAALGAAAARLIL